MSSPGVCREDGRIAKGVTEEGDLGCGPRELIIYCSRPDPTPYRNKEGAGASGEAFLLDQGALTCSKVALQRVASARHSEKTVRSWDVASAPRCFTECLQVRLPCSYRHEGMWLPPAAPPFSTGVGTHPGQSSSPQT